MISPRLTHSAKAATVEAMQGGKRSRRSRLAVLPVVGAMALGACVSVKAPDKPIVIELNINIRQEVVYRLAEDAKNTIESNPEIF
ncbi:MAG: YnbE family lipoprotein [Novosphingobium sp.]|nr:YnbE family lipoprotein [Novosphingobium sp.]